GPGPSITHQLRKEKPQHATSQHNRQRLRIKSQSVRGTGSTPTKLAAEGLEPTLERVRAKLGGGSYTTINRALAQAMQAQQTGPGKIADIPADLIEIGQKAVAAVYTAVQRQTMATIESIEADTRRQVEATQAARAEASLEIERLERDLESAADDLEQARQSAQEATSRAERAEARSEAQHGEIERLTREGAAAKSDSQAARESERNAESRSRKIEQDARREVEHLQKALVKAETSRDSAIEGRQRDADLLAKARAEAAESRQMANESAKRAERAEATLEALRLATESLRKELAEVREAERRARDEAAEMRGQIKLLSAEKARI
ncbi:MAG: DNA-binding protein, partial [Panacagrimonas sp.]